MTTSLFVETSNVAGYSPANHSDTVNRRLIHAGLGAQTLELLLGVAQASGSAHEHYHPGIDQLCYVLDGEALVSIAGQRAVLMRGQACYFPRGRSHSVQAHGGGVSMLVAYTPPYFERKDVGIPGPDPLSEPDRPGGIAPWPRPLFSKAPPPQAAGSLAARSGSFRALVDAESMHADALTLHELTLPASTEASFEAVESERALYLLAGTLSMALAGQDARMRPGMVCYVPPGVAFRLGSDATPAHALVYEANPAP